MGRESLNEGTEVVRSSIALLQERFRELQRVKTMREQREVSRTIALSEQEKHSMHYKPADEAVRLFLNPSTSDHHHLHQVQLADHGHVSSSPPSSLSLWPALHLHKRKHNEDEYYIHKNKRKRRSINETSSVLINLWPELAVDTDTPSSSSSSWNKLETSSDCDDSDHDVDTSLHL